VSDTLIDLPKVTQMLDAGWRVKLFKNSMGSYTAEARHHNLHVIKKANLAELENCSPDLRDVVEEFQRVNKIETDDFTPEQALTRLAYKIHGEIL
jgi:hypothetical protein